VRKAWLFLGWTGFVWVTRVKNVFGDDDLGVAEQAERLVVPVVMLVLAGYVAWSMARRRNLAPLRWLAAATIAVWLWRGSDILFGDHSGAFKVVHTVLGVISIGLALLAANESRAVNRPESPASRPTPV
jgi:hypothetical protein